MMNLPDGNKLILTIDEVRERECKDCEGKGYYYFAAPYGSGGPPRTGCNPCHGTGKRTVRLRGWCEVEVDPGDHTDPGTMYLPREIANVLHEESIKSYGKDGDELRDIIIAAYLDGTLPDGVAHIEEVEVD